jgi:hypothetical protein
VAKVTVYDVKIHDLATDKFVISRRMATHVGAKIMHGEVMEESATEIDEADLEKGEPWTPRDFIPQALRDNSPIPTHHITTEPFPS